MEDLMSCKYCNYKWTPRTEGIPKECTRCKRYLNKPKKQKALLECNKCSYEWSPRILNLNNVRMCPKCKTRKWNS